MNGPLGISLGFEVTLFKHKKSETLRKFTSKSILQTWRSFLAQVYLILQYCNLREQIKANFSKGIGLKISIFYKSHTPNPLFLITVTNCQIC